MMHWLHRLKAKVPVHRAGPGDQRPIFSAAGRDYAAMRRAIAERGCFVLRGLFDPRALARIRERAEALARAWDDKLARGDIKGFEDYIKGPFQAGHLPETQIDPE
jgi:hypothetical protein